MEYLTIIYLLLSIGVGETVEQQLNYQQTYVQNQTISDAGLVQNDPRFPQSYRDRNGSGVRDNQTNLGD